MRRKKVYLIGLALSACLAFTGFYKGKIAVVRADDENSSGEGYSYIEMNNENQGDDEIDNVNKENVVASEGDTDTKGSSVGEQNNEETVPAYLNQQEPIDYDKMVKSIIREFDPETGRDILYLVDPEGNPVTQIGFHINVEGKPEDYTCYVMSEDGQLATGWLELEDELYYFNDWEGDMVRGVFNGYNRITRRYDQFVADYEGKISLEPGWCKVIIYKGMDYWYNPETGEDEEREFEDERTFYKYNDGSLYTGWQEIDGKKYYFIPEMCQDEWMIDNDGNKYYFDENGQVSHDPLVVGEDHPWGVIYPDSDGFKDIEEAIKVVKQDGKDYVFDDGIMLVDTFVEIEDKEVYVRPDGTINYGWYKRSNGKWLYSYEDGSLPEDGWKKVGAFNYYFIHGEALSGGTYRFSNEDDSLIDYGGGGFYMSSYYDDSYELTIRKNAIIANGLVKESDIYMDSDSDRLRYFENGEEYYGWVQVGDDWYFIENSYVVSNRYEWLSDKDKIEEEEVLEKVKYDIEEDKMYNYGFDSTGKLIVNKWYQFNLYGNKVWFYADKDGKGMNGWLKWKNEWYYLDNGIMLADAYTPDNFYVDKDGKWDWNWNKYTEFTTNEYGMTVLKDREDQRGWLTGPGGKFYYVAEGYYYLSGYGYDNYRNNGVYKNGYYVIPDKDGETAHIYWFSKAGLSVKKPVTKGWKSIGNGNWLYAGDDGIAYTGWVGDYYVENGYMIRDRFLEVTYDEEKKENKYQTVWYFPETLDEESKVNYMFIDNKGKAVKGKYTVPFYNFYYFASIKSGYYDLENLDYVIFTDEKTGYLIKDKGFYTDASGGLYYLFASGITYGARKGQIIERDYNEKTNQEIILVLQNAGKLATGWVKVGDVKGYLNKDATVYDGMLEEGENKYFFDHGYLITDSFISGTKALYAGVDGRVSEKNPFKK